jgi:hypothetical protein
MSKQENKKTRKQENKETRKQENNKTRKQENKKTKKSEGSKSCEYDGSGGCSAIRKNCHRKTFVSLLLDIALHCPHARPTSFHFSLHAQQRNEFGENISDMVGGHEHLSFWHGMAWHQKH